MIFTPWRERNTALAQRMIKKSGLYKAAQGGGLTVEGQRKDNALKKHVAAVEQ